MLEKKNITKSLHRVFSFLPQSSVAIFETCQKTCLNMAFENDFDKIESSTLKKHLSICKDCWNYYQQMKIIDKKISESIQTYVSQEKIKKTIKRFSNSDF